MKASVFVAIVSAGGAVAAPPAGFAQPDDVVTIAVGDCIALESADERLACFERKVDAALERSPSGADGRTLTPEPGRSREPGPEGALTPKPEATLTPEPAPEPTLARERAPEREPVPEQIVSRIGALEETVPNVFVITLENGQIWRQVHSERIPLRVGYQVSVYPTRWGNSYRLTTEASKGFMQVERIR